MSWAKGEIESGQLLKTQHKDVSDISNPNLLKVLEYWDRVRADNFAPSLRSFRLEELPVEIIPSMAIVDILGPPLDYYYRFFGTKMVEHAGFDLSFKTYFADNVQGYGYVNAEIFPIVIRDKKPIVTLSNWRSIKGLDYSTTTIRLPLSANGEDVTNVVTVNSFEQVLHKLD